MAEEQNLIDKVSDKVDEIDNDLKESIDGYVWEGTYESVKEEIKEGIKDAAIDAVKGKAISKGKGLLRKAFTESQQNNTHSNSKPKKEKPIKYLTPKQKAAKHGRFIGIIVAAVTSLIGFTDSIQAGVIGVVLSFLIIPFSCGYGWTRWMDEPDFFTRIVYRLLSLFAFALGSFAVVVSILRSLR